MGERITGNKDRPSMIIEAKYPKMYICFTFRPKYEFLALVHMPPL